MTAKESKGRRAVAAFENGDELFGIFFWWLLERPAEERQAILREGLPLRRLVDDVAPRKVAMPRLRGRGKGSPSPGAYPYAVTACLRRRDYFVLRDPAAREILEQAGQDTFAYRRDEVIDTRIVPNPSSKDAQARGFPYALVLAGGVGEGMPPAPALPEGEEAAISGPSAAPAPKRRTKRAPAEPEKAARGAEEPPAFEDDREEDGEAAASREGSAYDEEERTLAPSPPAGRGGSKPAPERAQTPARTLPPAYHSAAPAWQGRPPRAASSPEPVQALTAPPSPPARPWSAAPAPRLRERYPSVGSPREDVAGFAEEDEAGFPGRGGRPERRGTGERSARPPVLLLPPPPLLPRTPEEMIADYLSSGAGPPLVNLVRTPDGRPRYAGWTADFGREVAPGRRSLDLRSDRDLVALVFLAAASSLAGGLAAPTELLASLFSSNLVTTSFWRDEATLLKVGAPKRIPIPQPLQLALHVIARNEAEIRAALSLDEIVAGKKPTLDVERVYRTLMSEKMEMPRYWRGPFKRNRRHRQLLPSRLGRVLVMRIPTLLRELHLQGVAEIDPAECCTADKIVRRAMFAAKIPLKKPINRMAALRENSRAIFERFGELFEMPLYSYGRTWRRRPTPPAR